MAGTYQLDLNDEQNVAMLAETATIDVRPPSINDGRTSDLWQMDWT